MKKKYYKAFKNDMRCRRFKFEIGKTYEEADATMCHSGFHFCENPLDCLRYYGLIDNKYDLNIVKMNRVTPLSKIIDTRNEHSIPDTKRCCKKIRIDDALDIDTIIKESYEYMINDTNTKVLEYQDDCYTLNGKKLTESYVHIEENSINITNNFQNLATSCSKNLSITLKNSFSNVLLNNIDKVYVESSSRFNTIVFDKVNFSTIYLPKPGEEKGNYGNQIICYGNNNHIINRACLGTNIVLKGTNNKIESHDESNIWILPGSEYSTAYFRAEYTNGIVNRSNFIDINLGGTAKDGDRIGTTHIYSKGDNCNIYLKNTIGTVVILAGKDCNISLDGGWKNAILASIGTNLTITYISENNEKLIKNITIDGVKYKENLWYGLDKNGNFKVVKMIYEL